MRSTQADKQTTEPGPSFDLLRPGPGGEIHLTPVIIGPGTVAMHSDEKDDINCSGGSY